MSTELADVMDILNLKPKSNMVYDVTQFENIFQNQILTYVTISDGTVIFGNKIITLVLSSFASFVVSWSSLPFSILFQGF